MPADATTGILINDRCLIRTEQEYRIVVVSGIPLAQYAVSDRVAESYAMVNLVEQGWASQKGVARAFGCSTRSVRRYQCRLDTGGLSALGHPRGYPSKRPRVSHTRERLLGRLKGQGMANKEIARRLGVTPKAIRKLLKRIGWRDQEPEHFCLPIAEPRGDPKLSAFSPPMSGGTPEKSSVIDEPISSARVSIDDELPLSFDSDPADRRMDRLLAYLGMLDDAAPLFRSGAHVPHGGVLLALPALVQSGIFTIVRKIYGSIGPAFYGLRTTFIAIKEFNEELARRPKDYLAHYMLGLVLIQERRYKEAAGHLQKAQGIEPSKPDPELFLGQALFLSDQQEAAIPHLQKAIELTTDPGRNNYQVSKAHYMLGQYLNRHGKADEAQKHMDLASEYKVKAAALDQEKVRAIMGGTGGPNDIKVQAASETPSVLTSRNDLTPAERSKLKDAEKVYTHIAETAYNRLGLLRAGQSDFRRAAQLLSRAVQWQPDIPDLQFNLGLACYKAQNYVEAIAPLLKAREEEPLRTDVQVLLGLSYFYAEQYREGGRVLTSLAAAGNEDPQVRYALGLCHAYAGDREMGKRILQNLAEKYPAVADTHVALGRAFALDANYDAAAAEFSRALEIDPRLGEVHYHKGLTLVRQKRNAEAADEFRQELQLNPAHAKAAYHLGFCLSSLDQLDEARTYLNTALRLNPGYVDAYYEMGKVQIRKGATAEAIASLQKAAELGGERSYIQYQLSQALLRAGRNEEAQAALARYREYKAKEQAARGAAHGEPETK